MHPLRTLGGAHGRHFRIAALILVVVLHARGGSAAESAPDPERTLVVDGVSRTYRVHVPRHYKATVAVPLLLAFHGSGSTAKDMADLTSLDKVADRAGFLAVYPQSLDDHWHSGLATASPAGPDDLGFVRALLARLESDFAVDRQRVYATGFSNGAFFCQRLACAMTADFAAVASVSGQMPQALALVCKPTRPISVLLVHGNADPIVPYDGSGEQGSSGLALLSVAATAAFWEHADACPGGGGATFTLHDASPADGTHVRREAHAGCADGTEVTLYTVDHGGHTWPDGPLYDRVWIIGKVSHALDASATIWEFLARHPLPANGTP
jgi:polyhydroxybutyrate depolymerase